MPFVINSDGQQVWDGTPLPTQDRASIRAAIATLSAQVAELQAQVEALGEFDDTILISPPVSNISIPASNTDNLDPTNVLPNGYYNTWLGIGAGASSTQVKYSTFVGYKAGNASASMSWGVFLGARAAEVWSTGTSNVVIGAEACLTTTSGGANVFIGYAVSPLDNGANNQVVIGASAQPLSGGSNQIVIGYAAQGNGANTATIGNSSITATYISGALIPSLPVILPSYYVNALPSASTYNKGIIHVANGSANQRLAVSDGSSWRFPDGTIVN